MFDQATLLTNRALEPSDQRPRRCALWNHEAIWGAHRPHQLVSAVRCLGLRRPDHGGTRRIGPEPAPPGGGIWLAHSVGMNSPPVGQTRSTMDSEYLGYDIYGVPPTAGSARQHSVDP